MAKIPDAVDTIKTKTSDVAPASFILEKNFGWVERGAHHFLEKGRELLVEEEGDLIAKLHRLGAEIKAKV